MGGMAPSVNCTSTAGPAIWITFPIFSDIDLKSQGRWSLVVGRWSLVVGRSLFAQGSCHVLTNCRSLVSLGMTTAKCFLLCCRSTYYFDNLFCNLRLARAIHD